MSKEKKSFKLFSVLKTKFTPKAYSTKSGESSTKTKTPKPRQPWVYRNE